jgi:F0F1-type ATP synthase gamma subunit
MTHSVGLEHTEIVKLLLDFQAKDCNIVINKHLSAMTTEPTESQLAKFRLAEDVKAMKQIIETTNINVNHGSAIVEAAEYGRNDIVELLIAAGADVNIIRQDNNVNINIKIFILLVIFC